MEIKPERQENGDIDECIRIPIYFYQDEDTRKVIIDEESIYDELREKLDAIKEKPEDFVEIDI